MQVENCNVVPRARAGELYDGGGAYKINYNVYMYVYTTNLRLRERESMDST